MKGEVEMKRIELVKIQFETKKKEVAELQKELERLTEDVNQEVEKGNYNMAGQLGTKLSEIAYRLDTMKKDVKFFEEMVGQLEQE